MSCIVTRRGFRHAALLAFAVSVLLVCPGLSPQAVWAAKRSISSPSSRVRTRARIRPCLSFFQRGGRQECHAAPDQSGVTGKTSSGGPPQPAWSSLFDGRTLAPWESAVFGGEGEVTVEDGQIMLDFGAMLTGVTRKGDFPKSDYEIRLEAMRVDGIDFFCALTFPVQDSHCTFVVGGWAGAVVGLSNIDGRDASENKTTRYMAFDDNRWYRIRVRVTADKIQAWIDDERVVDQEIQGRRISIRPEVDLCTPLGIACWQTRAALRNIEYRRLIESD